MYILSKNKNEWGKKKLQQLKHDASKNLQPDNNPKYKSAENAYFQNTIWWRYLYPKYLLEWKWKSVNVPMVRAKMGFEGLFLPAL